jgi:phage shock protein C
LEPKKMYRVREGRKICGVCQGAAEYLNLDVTLVRALWVVAALCGSVGFWAYLVFAIALPDKPQERGDGR